MRRINKWYMLLGVALLTTSVGLYSVHYLIFRDAQHLLSFLLEAVAFVPLQVLLITFIIEELLNEREKRSTISRLNMVVGAFFNEIGIALLAKLPAFDENPQRVAPHLLVNGQWDDKQFLSARRLISRHDFRINSQKGDLNDLKTFLGHRKTFLLRLLENPTLTEYESFTEMLLAVFHLSDELSRREKTSDLPADDYHHLSIDTGRAYRALIFEWLRFMNHLKHDYPYLFSLAVRTNPFDPEASVIVKTSSK
ncbi:MAG: hypothetical protein P4N41_19245 [Negativicutes bacterium]|nr:hypothetical protein [Negativicutes bacterium]